jgi:Ca-activated chloride channel family protein
MTFAWPDLFWLLLVPLALLAADLLRRSRAAGPAFPKIVHAEAGARQLSYVTSPTRRRRPRVWLALGLVLCVGALARPQWGRIEEPVFDQAREIIIAIDLSRSMLSPDVKPSRLDRAKLLTQSLLEKLSGERVGLISFAGTAFVQSPLSSDYEILREFLPLLSPEFLPEGGTNYRALIETSVSAFGKTNADRFLIVLSDGEATDDDWRELVPELKKKNIRVISLGVGTSAGAMIPDGTGGFVKDERGAVVLSKLEGNTLQELASVTGGTYRDASSWLDLASVLNATVEAGQKGRFVEKNNVRLVERFQWPLAFGLWCLLVSFCFEFPVRPRPRALQISPAQTSRATTPVPPVLAALLVFGLVGAGFILPHTARAEDNPATALTRIVGRLSAKDQPTARDWAELARETVSWGQRLQDDQHAVPEPPVRDALAAVDLGSSLDRHTADWPKLREELEALLKKQEQQKQNQQQKQQQQNQSQQHRDEQDQNDQQGQQGQSKEDQDAKSKPRKSQDQQQDQKSQPENQKNDPSQGRKSESAFGDMQQREQPPPSQDTQKVGGVPEKKPGEKTPADTALTLPMQKLEQLRNSDSPAQLFQLMDADNHPTTPKKKGKDW